MLELNNGRAVASLEVHDKLANAFSTMHGGAICTLVDVLGTLALLSVDSTRPGVKTMLHSTTNRDYSNCCVLPRCRPKSMLAFSRSPLLVILKLPLHVGFGAHAPAWRGLASPDPNPEPIWRQPRQENVSSSRGKCSRWLILSVSCTPWIAMIS